MSTLETHRLERPLTASLSLTFFGVARKGVCCGASGRPTGASVRRGVTELQSTAVPGLRVGAEWPSSNAPTLFPENASERVIAVGR